MTIQKYMMFYLFKTKISIENNTHIGIFTNTYKIHYYYISTEHPRLCAHVLAMKMENIHPFINK